MNYKDILGENLKNIIKNTRKCKYQVNFKRNNKQIYLMNSLGQKKKLLNEWYHEYFTCKKEVGTNE